MRSGRILVFRIGQLGDTVIALPAIHAVRAAYPKAAMTLLCDKQVGREYVLAPDLLEGSGLFDDHIIYPFAASTMKPLLQPVRMAALLARLRSRGFETLVYLAPSGRPPAAVARDRRFFALAGITRFIGFDGFHPFPVKVAGRPLEKVPHEADLLLSRLAASGVPVPVEGKGDMNLGLTAQDDERVDAWLSGLPADGGRAWIGVGPGSKMPVKVWPEENFRTTIEKLITGYDLWPVVFGGAEDREKGERLLRSWGRGYNAAGPLRLRPAAAALRRCRLYLGNDTGPMHLAASVGTRCIAVFSSRDRPGAWYPYGEGHRVFRTEIDCDGCALVECIERRMECILSIRPEAVVQACEEMLRGE